MDESFTQAHLEYSIKLATVKKKKIQVRFYYALIVYIISTCIHLYQVIEVFSATEVCARVSDAIGVIELPPNEHDADNCK